jgi:hypothetical protein
MTVSDGPVWSVTVSQYLNRKRTNDQGTVSDPHDSIGCLDPAGSLEADLNLSEKPFFYTAHCE